MWAGAESKWVNNNPFVWLAVLGPSWVSLAFILSVFLGLVWLDDHIKVHCTNLVPVLPLPTSMSVFLSSIM